MNYFLKFIAILMVLPLSLSGCFAVAVGTVAAISGHSKKGPPPTPDLQNSEFIGNGSIVRTQIVAKNYNEYKREIGSSAKRGALIGAGALGGLALITFPPAALLFATLGGGVGAASGGVAGAIKQSFKKGYVLARMQVEANEGDGELITALQFTQGTLQPGTEVEIYKRELASKKNKRSVYFIKPLLMQ